MTTRSKIILLLTIPIIVLLLDQATKYWAFSTLSHGMFGFENSGVFEKIHRFLFAMHPISSKSISLFDSWWSFKYVENSGAIFGFASSWSSPLKPIIFLALSSIVSVFLILYYFLTKFENKSIYFAMLFVLGGAFGNLTDRFARGYVIDFIDWHIGGHYHWATFNVADAFISVGGALLAINFIILEMATHKEQREIEANMKNAEETEEAPSE